MTTNLAYHENIEGSHIDKKGIRKPLLQVIELFLDQRKKAHLLHQGYEYTLQGMIGNKKKSLEIIHSFSSKIRQVPDPVIFRCRCTKGTPRCSPSNKSTVYQFSSLRI